jgi:hypothetical protein
LLPLAFDQFGFRCGLWHVGMFQWDRFFLATFTTVFFLIQIIFMFIFIIANKKIHRFKRFERKYKKMIANYPYREEYD